MKSLHTDNLSCYAGHADAAPRVHAELSQNEQAPTITLQVKYADYRALAQRALTENCSIENLIAQSILALLEK